MSTATSSRMTSTISQNSPFPQNAFSQNSFSSQSLPYPQSSPYQQSSPFQQSSPYQQSSPFQNSSYPQTQTYQQIQTHQQIQRNSSFQQNIHHSSVRQVQECTSSSSSSPSSASSASASFPLGTLPPSFDHSHLIDGIPVTYILEKLHLLGPTFYNDKETAFAELHINSLPNTTFFVHKEYLILQSIFFRQAFERVKKGDCITITLPTAPETFQPILEYLYTGDDDKWYETMTVENWSSIYKNVQFLGLCAEAKAVCMTFYENEIEPTLHDEPSWGNKMCAAEGFGAVTTS